MNEFILRLLSSPSIGRMALNMEKNKALRPFQIPLSSMCEKQEVMLRRKLRRLGSTEIGRKLGVKNGISLEKLPITDYEFYAPFFSNPSPSAFMYPLEAYERIKTSGTGGKDKWFMIPRDYLVKSTLETGIPSSFLFTHNGKEIAIGYGDEVYVNTAPRPYVGSVMISLVAGRGGKFPLFNITPNQNIPFEDKVRYFIHNCERIDLAVIQASILVSRVMPEVHKNITLKGIYCPDSAIAEAYFDEITRFVGVNPRTTWNSTETLDCTLPSVEHPLGFFLDWRRGIFEFIPVEDSVPNESKVASIDEVEVGKVYQVVYTSPESELTRYNIADAFRCIARGDNVIGTEAPIFKFHARLDKTISLHNFTRISEDELITVFRECKIPFVEFTARAEISGGLEYLVVYLETTEDREVKELGGQIHSRLYSMDDAYRDLTDYFSYVPVKVSLVSRGAFAKYLSGQESAIAKVDRIDMKEELFRRLIG